MLGKHVEENELAADMPQGLLAANVTKATQKCEQASLHAAAYSCIEASKQTYL